MLLDSSVGSRETQPRENLCQDYSWPQQELWKAREGVEFWCSRTRKPGASHASTSFRGSVSGQRSRNHQITLSVFIRCEIRPYCRDREAKSSPATGREALGSKGAVAPTTSSAIRKPGNKCLSAKPHAAAYARLSRLFWENLVILEIWTRNCWNSCIFVPPFKNTCELYGIDWQNRSWHAHQNLPHKLGSLEGKS